MFETTDFRALFNQFTNQRLLIIGDVMVDTYLWGNVGRVSPEAPVPIVSGVIEESRLGGAANVALNVKAMGAVPILCSVIGDDERGRVFLELMEEQNLSMAALCVIAGLDPPEVAAISNLAGGQVCEKAGVVPVDSEKLLTECEHYFNNS